MNNNNMMLGLCIILIMLSLAALSSGSSPDTHFAKPGCPETCENSSVRIPYPFGIGKNCYYNPWYEIICNNSFPFLKKFSLQLLYISSCLDNNGAGPCYGITINVAYHWHRVCNNGSNKSSQLVSSSIDLTGSPFSFSESYFAIRGCSGNASVMNRDNEIIGSCSTECQGEISINSTCDGIGCCLIPLTRSEFYRIGFSNVSSNTCVEYTNIANSDSDNIARVPYSAILWNEWDVEVPKLVDPDKDKNLSCSYNRLYHSRQSCEERGPPCYVSACNCARPFIGNPYLAYGCQDPCKLGTNHSPSCKKPILSWRAVLGISISLGLVSLILFSYCFYRLIKRWRRAKKRALYFKKNGGLLLQQQMTSTDGNDERTHIFTAEELKNATDNFNSDRILGQGTVYKGMLLDGRVVAVKMSVKVDASLLQQFINEVVILSQINHRGIVKLLGCCLETQVPSLVYEFIPNGTLAEHLHNQNKEDLYIPWKTRLQIAAEASEALMYLHSYSTMPIYHRDVKSSNILLDANYRAKVSDFGTSRTILIDQTHLTTRVIGTYGYLDPEYFQSHQFTDKSDVYSFGVVLAELLTGKKPLSETFSDGWKNLAGDFLSHMETSRLVEILDSRIVEEAKEEELMSVANIAKKCLNINGRNRPTMKEVVDALERIRTGKFFIRI